MTKQEETQLIKRIQEQHCVQSFTLLITRLRLYREVFYFVQRYLSNPSDAEEVTQETMFRAFRNIHGFDPERGRFRSWVFGIAIHRSYDRLNERKHRSLFEIEDMPLHHRSPEDMLNLMQMEEALVQAIDQLGERYRRILVLYYVEGMSHKEIATHEGITPNNAGTILNRAKERCVTLYEQQLKNHRQPVANKKPSQGTLAFADLLAAINHRLLHSGASH